MIASDNLRSAWGVRRTLTVLYSSPFFLTKSKICTKYIVYFLEYVRLMVTLGPRHLHTCRPFFIAGVWAYLYAPSVSITRRNSLTCTLSMVMRGPPLPHTPVGLQVMCRCLTWWRESIRMRLLFFYLSPSHTRRRASCPGL